MGAESGSATDRFRRSARAWLRRNAPALDGPAGGVDEYSIERQKQFQAALYDAGFAGIDWPEPYGGRGLSSAERVAFAEEARAFELPVEAFAIGLGMIGPTLLDLGTEEQKLRYLPPLLRGDEVWCQLFSEPHAGSDVASLQTKATRQGDDGWVLNGQKVWTSGAHHSDFGIVLARTDPSVPKHRGITMFVVDMRAPGIDVRPLKVITGDAPFNEVFFDDVRVPGDAVVGTVDGGWEATYVMLRHERTFIASNSRVVRQRLAFDRLREVAGRLGRTDDLAVQRGLALLYAHESCRTLFGERLTQEVMEGVQTGPRGSIGKLATAEVSKMAVEVAVEVLGPELAGFDVGGDVHDLVTGLLEAPRSGIAGGTDEIQRNIVAERILGLPKDPGVDRETPFDRLRIGSQRR